MIRNDLSTCDIEVSLDANPNFYEWSDFIHPEDYDGLVDKLALKEKDIVFTEYDVLQCKVFPDKGLPLRVYQLRNLNDGSTIEPRWLKLNLDFLQEGMKVRVFEVAQGWVKHQYFKEFLFVGENNKVLGVFKKRAQ